MNTAQKRVKIKAIGLFATATDKSTFFNTCCQRTAYKPIITIIPKKKKQYSFDKNPSSEAYFEKIVEKEYIKKAKYIKEYDAILLFIFVKIYCILYDILR